MRLIRTVLYVLLIIIAAATLLSRPYLLKEIRAGLLDPTWILVGPIAFATFFALFLIEELTRSWRAKIRPRLPFAPFAFGILLIALAMPSAIREYQTRRTPARNTAQFFSSFLDSKDARVRALLMMTSSCHADLGEGWADLVDKGLADKDPLVQESAIYALEHRLGLQFPEGSEGLENAKNALKNWQNSFFMAKKSLQ